MRVKLEFSENLSYNDEKYEFVLDAVLNPIYVLSIFDDPPVPSSSYFASNEYVKSPSP